MVENIFKKIKDFFFDLFFPKFCLGCKKEGEYLCQDCKELIEILRIHKNYKTKYLSDLYFPLVYKKPLVKKLILTFKFEPFLKDLSFTLASIIFDHLRLIEKEKDFSDFILIPIPIEKKRLKWRGFNQSEEIGKKLAKILKIPIFCNVLLKTKKTSPQIELSEKERKENVKGCFSVKNRNLIKNKKILLLDDVYTTGATMEEAAKTLKEAGAKEIVGMVLARAEPGEDKLEEV
jgi:competence protein ComFC